MSKIYAKPGKYAIGNLHFDTFRGNAEVLGALPVDYVIDEGMNSVGNADCMFKGDIDLKKVEKLIAEKGCPSA